MENGAFTLFANYTVEKYGKKMACAELKYKKKCIR
jgi:hypothetical protein